MSTLPVPIVSGPLLNSTPSEAFVVFSDNRPNYLALLGNLLDSVHYFSTRPVIAYGIDVDLALDATRYPRLIKRRLARKDCGYSVYFCKIYAIVHSQLDYGVQLEADSVVNWNVDILFDVIRRWPYSLPLAPRHPDDPMNYRYFLNRFGLRLTDRTTPYMHAQFSWNYRAYPFLRRALALMRDNNFNGANLDETGMNILLWQAKANHTLCRIDPFFTYLDEYEKQSTKCLADCHKVFILLHGGKELNQMRDVFNRLKKHAGSAFIQTENNNLHYLNETQYTCCYPSSRPSSIHPLLCEYVH
ncbi:unnamed protein product [Rotaria socialis]|uniref:Uncharacterized protein n=1 Tax=Rotaria socialis TaxID=392032 RepID=A0A819AIW9_9BILA|nr:unnamed protein product [Rotaria socialis]CAF3555582.1 unnamed protein product [Rotaria socialis]CAF3778146.1 unnamed protein product [Rotaria socialis]CAF4572426.1 unnamed protein product [Rotaria socialis]CAF4613157.1 unnamed protein product [Rotaria socialis]